jgi:hypothetical protein
MDSIAVFERAGLAFVTELRMIESLLLYLVLCERHMVVEELF